VSWSSSDGSVATIDAKSGLAMGQDQGGQCNIAASVTVADQTISGSTKLNVTALLKSISVTPANASIKSEQQLQYQAIGTYSDGHTADVTSLVSWSSSDGSVATIDAKSGLAMGQDQGGQCTITGSTLVAGKTISGGTNLTVTAILKSITVTPANQSIDSGTPLQYKATGTYSDGHTMDLTSQVTWSSSDTSVASIDAKSGLATGQDKGGQCRIAASITVAGQSIAGSTSLNVASILKSISVTPVNASINSEQQLQYKAVGTYSDGHTVDLTSQVTWSSSDASVAIIDVHSGLATGQEEGGQCSISASVAVAGQTISGETNLTVSSILKSITVTPANASINSEQQVQYKAVGTYSDGHTMDLTSQVAWTSSDPSVASIDAKGGLATGQDKGGQCAISASVTVAGQSIAGSTNLNVTSILKSISVTPANANINSEQPLQYNAIGTYSDGRTADLTSQVTWSSSDSSVASIDAHSGLATGQDKGGQCAIFASISVAGQEVSSSTNLTVTSILKSITINPPVSVLPKRYTTDSRYIPQYTQRYTATGHYSNKDEQDITSRVTWNSSNPSVASIDASGLAVSNDIGTTNIIASLDGISSVTPGTGSLTIKQFNSVSLGYDQASCGSDQMINGYFQGHDPCQFTAIGGINEDDKSYVIDPNYMVWNTELIAPPGVDLKFDGAVPGKISMVPSGNWSFVLYGYLDGQQGLQGVKEWCNPDPDWGCGDGGMLGVTQGALKLKKNSVAGKKETPKAQVSRPKALTSATSSSSAEVRAKQKQIAEEKRNQEELKQKREEELKRLEEKERKLEWEKQRKLEEERREEEDR
jgi:hypothetical protein